MDAEGARRHQRLDAQHDSATRRCRVTSGMVDPCRTPKPPRPHRRKPQICFLAKSRKHEGSICDLHGMRRTINERTRVFVQKQSLDGALEESRRCGRGDGVLSAVSCGQQCVRAPNGRRPRRAMINRPCCATRSGCAGRPRHRLGGRGWSLGTTNCPASQTARKAGLESLAPLQVFAVRRPK